MKWRSASTAHPSPPVGAWLWPPYIRAIKMTATGWSQTLAVLILNFLRHARDHGGAFTRDQQVSVHAGVSEPPAGCLVAAFNAFPGLPRRTTVFYFNLFFVSSTLIKLLLMHHWWLLLPFPALPPGHTRLPGNPREREVTSTRKLV